MTLLCLLALFVTTAFAHCDVFWYQPEQVHLAFGRDVHEIVVTWSTFNDTGQSVVEYGIGGFILRATGTSKLFVDGGPKKRAQYIHRVTLRNLASASLYGKLHHDFCFP